MALTAIFFYQEISQPDEQINLANAALYALRKNIPTSTAGTSTQIQWQLVQELLPAKVYPADYPEP